MSQDNITKNSSEGQFYGKYRGTVINNMDPLSLGRIIVQVPAVLGLIPSSWALPCVPFAGKGTGFYFIPDIGSNVWIEFEGGNSGSPIWVGCFWGDPDSKTLYKNILPPPVPRDPV